MFNVIFYYFVVFIFFFFKQKTAYEMRISDWSSDVCSSDLDTLHPVYEGRAFFWRHDGTQDQWQVEYGPTSDGESADEWQKTSFYHLLSTGGSELRRRFCDGDPPDFAHLEKIRDEGQTDYVALLHKFPGDNHIGAMD